MGRALAGCEEHWPGQPVELGAQAHLTGFYGSLGFVAVSEPYDEDGIPHAWVARIKASLRTVGPRYCAARMVQEYVAKVYELS